MSSVFANPMGLEQIKKIPNHQTFEDQLHFCRVLMRKELIFLFLFAHYFPYQGHLAKDFF